jgi:hypothetical protein
MNNIIFIFIQKLTIEIIAGRTVSLKILRSKLHFIRRYFTRKKFPKVYFFGKKRIISLKKTKKYRPDFILQAKVNITNQRRSLDNVLIH